MGLGRVRTGDQTGARSGRYKMEDAGERARRKVLPWRRGGGGEQGYNPKSQKSKTIVHMCSVLSM